jgi:polar amino acid transport system permease protein
LVQIVFWSFIASLYPYLSLGIPFGHEFVIFNSNKLIPLFLGVVLGLGLNEAAYMAEIVRAGILSVDSGQTEAASALGMRRLDIMQRIVLPQAMRVVIPPTGNETISMLKTTSLAAFASFVELFKATQDISANIFKQIPLLMVASVWYLIFTSVLSAIQYYIERYYARGSSRQLPATPVQRVRAFMAQRADQSGSI